MDSFLEQLVTLKRVEKIYERYVAEGKRPTREEAKAWLESLGWQPYPLGKLLQQWGYDEPQPLTLAGATMAELVNVMKTGKLITTHDGRCCGPRYGEVYTAAAGQNGFVAGYRSHATPGLGLMGMRSFAKQKDAQDYAVQCTDI